MFQGDNEQEVGEHLKKGMKWINEFILLTVAKRAELNGLFSITDCKLGISNVITKNTMILSSVT